uniref:Uncharacterized protein n=1 Tax=Siphoviridae sp. ctbgC51 TaxID=2827901 RepID=A0A8S5TFL8_9CAUD|nr:MAG TPA: hypothetical protein [Siphoviridae sp. ctbgC51]
MKQVPSFGFSFPKGLVFYCLSCQFHFTGILYHMFYVISSNITCFM